MTTGAIFSARRGWKTLVFGDALAFAITFFLFWTMAFGDASYWGAILFRSLALGDLSYWEASRKAFVGHLCVYVGTLIWFRYILEHYVRRRPAWDELREITQVLSVQLLILLAGAFVVEQKIFEPHHALLLLLNFILIPVVRWLCRTVLDAMDLWKTPAILLGSGQNAYDACLALRNERCLGYQVAGYLDFDSGTEGVSTGDPRLRDDLGLQRLGSLAQLEEHFASLDNPKLILALDTLNSGDAQALLQRALTLQPDLHIIPSMRGLPLFGTHLSHFFSYEVLMLTTRNNLSRRSYQWFKRCFDLVAAIILLVLLAPLFLVLTLLIRQSGGTAFYGHKRVGQNGEPFSCMKFRSMRPDADKVLKDLLASDAAARAEWEKDFKLKNDPRITPVGHFLRKTSLDELPQLFNVVRGEMSLVGPRPVVPDELARYGDHVSLYLQVKPGITGLWQISGRNDTTYAERVSLDSWYVRNWSLWYDIAILVKTIDVVFRRRGAY